MCGRFFDGFIVQGERTYNTGDSGYLGKDGLLYYSGRENHQVKICGHRIELEEIEVRLQLVENIRNAIVEVKEDIPTGKKSLTAYVLLDQPNAIPIKESIERELKKTLPYYMIPKEYHICDQFPLISNGKVDRVNVSKFIKEIIK